MRRKSNTLKTHMEKSPSLNDLLHYVPTETEDHEIQKDIELYNKLEKTALQYYFDQLENVYSDGHYYLGGQLEMRMDEEITMEKINKVREIIEQKMKKYGEPCNSFEEMSISVSILMLNQVEEIVKTYLKLHR